MKRLGYLYDLICSADNIIAADFKARRNKKCRYGIDLFDSDRENNITNLVLKLKNKTYKTSEYRVFKLVVDSGKEREIYKLPYYPDRIVHHAIVNIMEPIWTNSFTRDTYSCIKGRGIHGAFRTLRKALDRDPDGTKYCLKLDVRKFYPSIDHEILKKIVRRKIKDPNLLWLLDEIIDSAPGVPIGNYLSQYLANLYLTDFDHWLKEKVNVNYYWRYCDDMVVLSGSKSQLRDVLHLIKTYLSDSLRLSVKNNWQIFPVDSRSIDFLGYCFYHTHTLLRKSIKKRFAKKVAKMKRGGIDLRTMQSSYYGWASHCNSRHLMKKLSA